VGPYIETCKLTVIDSWLKLTFISAFSSIYFYIEWIRANTSERQKVQQFVIWTVVNVPHYKNLSRTERSNVNVNTVNLNKWRRLLRLINHIFGSTNWIRTIKHLSSTRTLCFYTPLFKHCFEKKPTATATLVRIVVWIQLALRHNNYSYKKLIVATHFCKVVGFNRHNRLARSLVMVMIFLTSPPFR
jgi:hypothetical protein